VVDICAPQVKVKSCGAAELEPLAECTETTCADLPPGHLATCVVTSCQRELLALSRDCMQCVDTSLPPMTNQIQCVEEAP
jgi:hypothetical protein